jgi:hypothetical protein
MDFATKGFIFAGTAIAIFSVGLYFWGNNEDVVVNNDSQYKQGGSRRHKKRHNKTYKKGR